MTKLIHQLEQYLRDTLGVVVSAQPWVKSSDLPHYLRERYRFLLVKLLGGDCVLAVDTGEEEQAPGVIAKQLDQVRARHQGELVYVRHAVTSYNRKRLIDQKIPFIVPGNQMYLPMLGLDLREHMKGLREKKTVFSPATQALALEILWKKATVPLTPAEIAKRLGYSAMTMTRAFDELEAAGLGEHSIQGKERHLCFTETGRTLWEKLLPYLTSPVKRRVHVAPSLPMSNGHLAGESALAHYTMLADPQNAVFAFSVADWKVQMQHDRILELTIPEPGAVEIEIWKYAPDHFAQDGKVDRLSLYLSLKSSPDERVQGALDALLGGMPW